MARVLYFDCFSGAAGDMILAALIDAGLPLDRLREALGSLTVGHDLRVSRVMRAGLSATYVEVVGENAEDKDGDHGHHHDHGHAHGHRSLAEIAHLIGHSALSPAANPRPRRKGMSSVRK